VRLGPRLIPHKSRGKVKEFLERLARIQEQKRLEHELLARAAEQQRRAKEVLLPIEVE
jgi:hypothetical protein